MNELIKIIVSLLPVFLFLATLIFLDSYKLIKLKFVLRFISIGSVVALVCFLINVFLLKLNIFDLTTYSRYVSPIIEESFKSIYIIFLIKNNRLGFMVDCAIAGFAIGSGFAFIENVYYLNTLNNSNVLLWMVRGFGTAVMHGGTTAIFGIISINLYNRYSKKSLYFTITGLLISIIIHSLYNHFFLSPIISTVVILIILPSLIFIIFSSSEKYLKKWMELGLESDIYILESIDSGLFSETKYGKYLRALKDKFPKTVVSDMLCFIQLHTELAVRAKGILLMRESGFVVPIESEIKEKSDELKFFFNISFDGNDKSRFTHQQDPIGSHCEFGV